MDAMEMPMNIAKKTTLAAVLLVALGGVGCGTTSSSYQCPYTGGVRCMSAIDVYNKSEDGTLVGSRQGNANARSTTTPAGDAWAGETVIDEGGSLVIADSLSVFDAAPAQAQEDSPLLTPAKVLRVWIAPWEDGRGNLHMAGYVFSEISKRKWKVGNTAPASRPVLRLLDAPQGAGSSPQ